VLSYDALADDIPADDIVRRVLAAVPPPTVAPRQQATTAPAAAGQPQGTGTTTITTWPGR
jgi:MoxR-like ATPase